MRVLHINSYYSGSALYKNLYEKQIESGLNIDVYVPVSVEINESSLNLGDYTITSKNHNKYDRFIFHIKHNKIYKDIVKTYDINNISIIHAHSLFSNGFIALRLKKFFKIPYIVAVRNTDVNTFFKYMIHLRSLGIEILMEAACVVFLSKTYRDMVIDKYVPRKFKDELLLKTIILPNGINDYWLENKRSQEIYPKYDNLKLVFVGVINKNKNLLTIVESIEILRKKGWTVEFTVVGKILDESIYQYIMNLPYVKYIAPKPKEELIDIYYNNDIFIMPSRTETFGLVYAEAMSQGLPVIYSEGQGFDGQFEEGVVGYRVNYLNAEEIVDRISDIVINYKNISDNCVEKVKVFNWKDISDQYEKLYTKINNHNHV